MPVDAAKSIRLFGGWTGTGIPVNRPLVNDNLLGFYRQWSDLDRTQKSRPSRPEHWRIEQK